MKFKNLLTAAIAVVASVGISSQSFAIPVSMDAEGYVTYAYSGSVNSLGSSINIGDAFSSTSVFDNETIVDYDQSDDIGYYFWTNGIYTTTVNFGGQSFTTNSTQFKVQNNVNNLDIYQLTTWTQASSTELLIFDILLVDNTASALNDDSLILEPDLSLFSSTNFYIRSLNLESGLLNYDVSGVVTSLVDPPIQTASVPEPGMLSLVAMGLIGIGFSRRKTM